MEQNTEVTKQQTENGEVVTQKSTTTASAQEAGEVKKVQGVFQARYLVYYILGVVEVLLLLRLAFKLLGANPSSGFVDFLYSVTNVFIAPFTAIFQTATTEGAETTAVLEPATIIAMIVYALVAWGISALIGALLAGKE